MLLFARLIDLYSLVVLASVVVSWIGMHPRHPLVVFLHSVTDPVLAPIRAVLPPMAGLDFSPMVLLFLLQLLRGMVR